MRASYRWLKELSEIDVSAQDMADALTRHGLQVEAIEEYGSELANVVAASIRAKSKHPSRDQLTCVRVYDGTEEHDVVCGAPNVPEVGGHVALARVGAKLPNGPTIEPRKVGGVPSKGMLCSEAELGIGIEADGILVLPNDTKPGTPLLDALDLSEAIFELSITPNRPDALGHIGLAREIALGKHKPFSLPKPKKPTRTQKPAQEISIELQNIERCPRYGAGLVRDVTVRPSPWPMRYRLHRLGLRSINNIVDVTNLVLLETGHPIHAFDLAKLHGPSIVVRLAKDGEVMATLDGVERRFTSDDLLICDRQGPVAIAGVMGGSATEISDSTQNVLIECAYFQAGSIRRTSRRLGLHTEASHRFERGVDPEDVPHVMARAISAIERVAGGIAEEPCIDKIGAAHSKKHITFRPARVSKLVGLSIDPRETSRILKGVGCEVNASSDSWNIEAPSWRPDLQREADLIEEIVRVHGYDKIPTRIPTVRPSAEGSSPFLRFLRRAREHGTAAGLHETINYTFSNAKHIHASEAEAVHLANPLSEDRGVLRSSLLPGLLANAAHAQHRQVSEVRIFEVGRTFHARASGVPFERWRLGALLAGLQTQWLKESSPYDFYDGRGVVETVIRGLTGASAEFSLIAAEDALTPYLHPRKRARIHSGDTEIGNVGELHPDVIDAAELNGAAVYIELDLEQLFETCQRRGPSQFKALPKFPSVSRDIALVVEDHVTAGDIMATMMRESKGLAESVSLFDVYQGAPVPKGKKSLAFHVIYRDPKATLTDKHVDQVHEAVLKATLVQHHAEAR